VLLAAACGTGGTTVAASPPPPAATVVIRDVSFTPRVVRVTVGQSVRWVFDDGGLLHGVRGDGRYSQLLDSGIRSSGSYTVTFTTPGVYNYHCQVHSMMMTGQIVVSAPTSASPP
jgi:plastocyanin